MNNELEIKENTIIKYNGAKVNDDTEAIKITIPDGVKVIGKNAFALANIKEIVLPNSIERIEEGAFYLAFSLRKINISNSLKYIGSGAFAESNLEEINLCDNLEIDGSFLDCHCLKKVLLGENMIIREGSFEYCDYLEEITIPDSTEIIENAFWCCDKLNVNVSMNLIKKFGIDKFEGCQTITIDYNNESKKFTFAELKELLENN